MFGWFVISVRHFDTERQCRELAWLGHPPPAASLKFHTTKTFCHHKKTQNEHLVPILFIIQETRKRKNFIKHKLHVAKGK